MKKMDISVPEESSIEIPENKVESKINVRKVIKIIIIVFAILGVAGSLYFYSKYQSLKKDPTVEAQRETARLVGLLGKLMELPKDEIPTVATISDKEKLKGQVFFDQAENGDILFAYTTSMKAILYRPTTNKIINVAPININQTQDVSQGVKKTTPTAPAVTPTKKN